MKSITVSIVMLSALTGFLVAAPFNFSSAQSMSVEEIRNNLISNPPNTGDLFVRKQSILSLDTILCSDTARSAQSVFTMYTSMMEKVKSEIQAPVGTGASIWLMYNDGYIVKTPEIVFAFDLIGGYSGWHTQLPLELIDQIKIVFISHNHSDHVDATVLNRVIANGGFVVVPAENSNVGNISMAANDMLTLQGLQIKAYNGLHGEMPLRMYEVTCPRGLKVLHTGDNQTSESLPEVSNLDVLLLNAWVNESGGQPASIGMTNSMNKLNPKIMIPGHVQELAHNYVPGNPTGRLSYQAVYQVQDDSIAATIHAMIWGELYKVAENVSSETAGDTLLIEEGTIHLGDGEDNQGVFYTKSFFLSESQFSNLDSAIVTIEFIPHYGPNYEQPPIVSINATPLGSLQPFFPPVNIGNWQTNGDGSHDYNDSLHVSISVPKTIFVSGNNSFSIQNGRPDDDYRFTQVKITLSRALTNAVAVSQSGKIPQNFILHQNFPNPFNPTTTIAFSVGTHSYASLRVYDVLGREVATIFSGELLAGIYTRQWNAAGMPCGIYFYRLTAGSFTETKKLLLLK